MEHRIKDIIAQRKMTYKEFAAKVGISTVALNKLLNSQNSISMNRAEQFAELLDVEFWELFYTREELLNSVINENVGNNVKCPYCGKELILSIK